MRMLTSKVKIAMVLAMFLLVAMTYGQDKASRSDRQSVVNSTRAEKINFYYHSWDDSEIKLCETFPSKPYLTVCDDGDLEWKASLMHMISDARIDHGMSEEQSYELALAFATVHSKTFLGSFSHDPWPKSQSQSKVTDRHVWSCTKEKVIK
jgi:hypothetical protein